MLPPIPLRTPIVDANGQINVFFRERWEEVRVSAAQVAATAIYTKSGQTASLLTALLYTVLEPGIYRVTFTARRTIIDGAGSTLTWTWHWTDAGAPLSDTAPANATDTTGSLYTGTRTFRVDGNTNLTGDMAYVSTTPGLMTFHIDVTVEKLVQV